MIRTDEAHKKFVEHLKQKGKSASTIIAYEKDIEQLIEHLFKQGIEGVSEIYTEHLSDFMKKLSAVGLTNKTISRKTNATKTFFRFLKDNNFIQIDVAEQLKHPKVKVKAPRILSKLEYRALRDTARDDIRTFTMIEVLIQTGLSISELSLLEVKHINFENGVLEVPKRTSRNYRTVPLNKAAVEAMKKYLNEIRPALENAKHFFITKTGNALLVRNIRSTIDRYFKLAGVENAKVNDLRHTFIAHHLAQGTSIQLISKIVGHKRLSTTERYLEYIEKETEEEKMELGVL